jgi:N-acetylneuraminic acid mutarotase
VQAGILGKDIYVIGGFTADASSQAIVEVYDAAANAWKRAADYPVPINHHAVVAIQDGAFAGLYVFGGYASPPIPSEQATLPAFTSLAFKYTPATNAWTAIRPLPIPRAAHGAALLDGKIYIVGGASPDAEQALALTPQVDVYDPATDSYSIGPPLPIPRDHLTVAATAGKVYAIGGQQLSHDLAQADVEALDVKTGSWSKIENLMHLRAGLTSTILEGKVLAIGGENGTTAFPYVESLDPATGHWTSLPDLPTPRHGLGSTTWNGRAYVLLGGPRFGLTVTGAVESMGPAAT